MANAFQDTTVVLELSMEEAEILRTFLFLGVSGFDVVTEIEEALYEAGVQVDHTIDFKGYIAPLGADSASTDYDTAMDSGDENDYDQARYDDDLFGV